MNNLLGKGNCKYSVHSASSELLLVAFMHVTFRFTRVYRQVPDSKHLAPKEVSRDAILDISMEYEQVSELGKYCALRILMWAAILISIFCSSGTKIQEKKDNCSTGKLRMQMVPAILQYAAALVYLITCPCIMSPSHHLI